MNTGPDIAPILDSAMLTGRVRAGARHHGKAGKPYRPLSGAEGIAFDNLWCAHCTRDAAYRNDPDSADGCPIIANALAFEMTDPRYPKEWVHDNKGRPKCTAFTDDPRNPPRCERTLDMFEW